MPTPTRQLCAVLHDGRVLTDASRRLPAYDGDQHAALTDRAAASGDTTAVLVAPGPSRWPSTPTRSTRW